MPLAGRVLDVWSSNVPEVASLGTVGSNAYIRLFDRNSRTGKAVALGINDLRVSLTNISSGSNLSDLRFGVGTSNPASTLQVIGTTTSTQFVGNIDGSNLTSGTFPAARIPVTGVTPSIYGGPNAIPVLNIDEAGRVTMASNAAPQLNVSDFSFGTLDPSRLALSGVTAGNYGLPNMLPFIAVDDKGRVTAASNTMIRIDASNITTGSLPVTNGGTGSNFWGVNQILYGNNGNTLKSSDLFVNVNGSIGIGTANPIRKLHVEGDAHITGIVVCSNVVFASSTGSFQNINIEQTTTNTIVASNIGTGPALRVIQAGVNPLADFIDSEVGLVYRIANDGRVGMYTSNPVATFHINNTGRGDNPVSVQSQLGCNALTILNDSEVRIGADAIQAKEYVRYSENSNHQPLVLNSTQFCVYGRAVITDTLDIKRNLYVGQSAYITGANPFQLTVLTQNGPGGGIYIANYNGAGGSVEKDGMRLLTADTVVGSHQITATIDTTKSVAIVQRDGERSHIFNTQSGVFYSRGSVGIGTAEPQTQLHVMGNALASNITVTTSFHTPISSSPSVHFGNTSNITGILSPVEKDIAIMTAGVTRARFSSNGYTAMGDVIGLTPTAQLHVQGSNNAPVIQIHNLTSGGDTCIQFHVSKDATIPSAAIKGIPHDSNSAHITLLTQSTGSGSLTEKARLTTEGIFAIGTQSPDAATLLHVAGKARVNNQILTEQNYSWVADNNTYVHQPQTGTLGLTCSSSPSLRITSSNCSLFSPSNMETSGFHANTPCFLGKGSLGGYNTSFGGGAYTRQGTWTNTGGSHTILFGTFCTGENTSGTLYIQATNKGAASGKVGNAMLSFLKATGTILDIFIITIHKSATLSTFDITTDASNNIVVTTDSDCSVTWTAIGAH